EIAVTDPFTHRRISSFLDEPRMRRWCHAKGSRSMNGRGFSTAWGAWPRHPLPAPEHVSGQAWAAAEGAGASARVRFHQAQEGDEPGVEEVAAVLAHFAAGGDELVVPLDERLGLAERGHVEIGEDVAQVLLRHRGAGGADRDAEDAGGLAGPGAVSI